MAPGELSVKRKIILTIVTVLVIGAGAGSWWYVKARAQTTDFPSEVVTMMPSDSSVLVYANMAVLRGEPLAQKLAALAPAVQPGTDYAEFISATGFQYERDLDRVVFASSAEAGATSPPAHFLAIADGHFDQKKIEAYALRTGKEQQQNGHSIFTISSLAITGPANPGTRVARNAAFTFLTPSRIAIGNSDDVTNLLSKQSSTLAEAGLQEQISRVAGSPLFMVAKANSLMAKGNPMAAQFGNLRWVNIAARPDGNNVLLSAEGTCDTPDQAKQMASGLELLRGLLRGMLNDPKTMGNTPPEVAAAVKQIFQTAQISSDAARVRLLVNVDTALFKAVPSPAAR
jgi:hypothetical protein